MMRKKRFFLLLIFISIFNIHLQKPEAKEYYLEEWGSFLDLPQGITPIEITDRQATFSDSSEKVFFQIRVYSPKEHQSASDIFKSVKSRISAEGEGVQFSYYGNDAFFSDLRFNIGHTPFRGYSVFISSPDKDWVILSFCEEEVYDEWHFFLLSAIDSFSIDMPALYSQGPVSLFYETSFTDANLIQIAVPFENSTITLEADENAIEAAEITAEREALVLSHYKASDTDAWSRFYRMIYRDNYARTDLLFRKISAKIMPGLTQPFEVSTRLLAWLQDFSYFRTGTIADFSPPLSALKDHAGDCDSLGLLYILLLKRYRIDAVLMVSAVYSHSMAAVDIPGTGARFPFRDKQYLVAEMTEHVSIGMINAEMADPAKWLGIEFR